MAVNFYGPRLKVRRAKHHIDELERIFARYITANMKRVRSQEKSQPRKRASRQFGSTLPEHVPTIVGDAVHNLRVALDHAYSLLVEANNMSGTGYTRFPFGRDIQSTLGSINGTKPNAPSDLIINEIMHEIQPYAGGQLSLYELHRLDITDKHQTLLPTARALRIDKLDIVDDAGRTRTTFEGISFIQPHDGQASSAMIALNEGRGIKLQGDPHSTFDILFGPGPFHNESILRTLRRLEKNVGIALDKLERAA